MKSVASRFVAFVLVVSLFALPPGLSAKGTSGADLVVIRLDKTLVTGELIAVKKDSLLLLSGGKDLSVDLADIHSIRIVRKSRAGTGALYGGLGGSLAGALLGSGGLDEYSGLEGALLLGGYLGIIAGVGGLCLGAIMGVDTTIDLAGEPAAVVADRWARLQKYARERRLPGLTVVTREGPVPGESRRPAPTPAAAGASAPRHRDTHRFRLSVPVLLAVGEDWNMGDPGQGSFRFLGDVPPGDAGPYAVSLSRSYRVYGGSGFRSLSLAYEWSDRWLVEVEAVLSGRRARVDDSGGATFTSADSGKTYGADVFFSSRAAFSAALLGLTYRPFAPAELRRHVVEAGLAVGPAWAKLTGDASSTAALHASKLTFSARAHAAYDFYVVPTLSVGVIAGYQHLRVDLPAAAATATLFFWENNELINSIERLTEFTIPSRKIDASHFNFGLRITFRL